jgi:hypothetical protein
MVAMTPTEMATKVCFIVPPCKTVPHDHEVNADKGTWASTRPTS